MHVTEPVLFSQGHGTVLDMLLVQRKLVAGQPVAQAACCSSGSIHIGMDTQQRGAGELPARSEANTWQGPESSVPPSFPFGPHCPRPPTQCSLTSSCWTYRHVPTWGRAGRWVGAAD